MATSGSTTSPYHSTSPNDASERVAAAIASPNQILGLATNVSPSNMSFSAGNAGHARLLTVSLPRHMVFTALIVG